MKWDLVKLVLEEMQDIYKAEIVPEDDLIASWIDYLTEALS